MVLGNPLSVELRPDVNVEFDCWVIEVLDGLLRHSIPAVKNHDLLRRILGRNYSGARRS